MLMTNKTQYYLLFLHSHLTRPLSSTKQKWFYLKPFPTEMCKQEERIQSVLPQRGKRVYLPESFTDVSFWPECSPARRDHRAHRNLSPCQDLQNLLPGKVLLCCLSRNKSLFHVHLLTDKIHIYIYIYSVCKVFAGKYQHKG